MSVSPQFVFAFLSLGGFFACVASAADWPMWRYESGRTAASPETLPDELHLKWSLQLPRQRPAFRDSRLQFDAGYEPVVAGKRMFVASTCNDSVTAYDIDSGHRLWRFFTEGPVRLAPVVWKDHVVFGSDDGHVYCVSAADGTMVWKLKAAASTRKLLGNGRLISVWPVRGGPVLMDDIVYFAAGVWSFEGVFVYAVRAHDGEVVWRNDRLGYLYGQHPHAAEAFGGVTPQGYLVVNDDELIVPCGSAYPAVLDRGTGQLISFQLPRPGRLPGGWFASIDKQTASNVRRGKLTFDEAINRKQHEDKVYQGEGAAGVRRSITLGGQSISFDDESKKVPGTVYSLLAANRKFFVVTEQGGIYCFGADESRQNDHAYALTKKTNPITDHTEFCNTIVQQAHTRHGYAIVWGLKDGQLVRSLIQETDFHVIGVDANNQRLESLRVKFDDESAYGHRVSLLAGELPDLGFPPYLATVITSETSSELVRRLSADGLESAYRCLRPYGGVLCLQTDDALAGQVDSIADSGRLLAATRVTDAGTFVVRRESLAGAQNYRGGWQPNRDALVQAPLGVLWFDDRLGHFKRSPQPAFIDGVMISRPKDWHFPKKQQGPYNVDYPLLPPVFSDTYTGRVFADDEYQSLRKLVGQTDPNLREPSQYRPPTQLDAWNPAPPSPGRRINPMTGQQEPRTFPKSYGCDGGIDYGNIFTMRSGTAAIYDKTIESGTINISGPSSGCTNSIIPACGVLNVPYFFEGCTCSYPLPSGLALVSMPETHEQWMSWGNSSPEQIKRIGLNLGAPGDRMTRDGTLWLDVPNVGGPSPKLNLTLRPENLDFFYQHSMWVEGGDGWPWVTGSGVEGLSSLTLGNLHPGTYRVRLLFADPSGGSPRVQTIQVQNRIVADRFKLVREAGAPMRGRVLECDDVVVEGELNVQLKAHVGKTLVCGIEILPSPKTSRQPADAPGR